MKIDRFIRGLLALAIMLVFAIGIAALLFVTEAALNVWDRLLDGPVVLRYGFVAVLLALLALAAWLIWRLLIRRRPKTAASVPPAPLSRDEIEARLREAEAAGVDVAAARAELQALAERREAAAVHLVFFGEISTGKSSLIRALVPDADVSVHVVGGSTSEIRHYRWQSPAGAEVLLTDVPGAGGLDPGFDALAIEEAQRAQVVLFVCDGDLSRAERALVERLLGVDKPMIVVLNKADRFDIEEQAALMQRLLAHLDELGGSMSRDRIVAVSAGGDVEVVERRADGTEKVATRRRPADVGVLVVAINRLLDVGGDELDVRRDRAVFRLAADKLSAAEAEYRAQRAEQIIRNATRKAVIGALAAVSPGTDVLIQGYVGTVMTRELCKLYGAAPRDLDIEEFLNLSQSRVGRVLPLSLAVAGNGLKAFPGVGTVAGGLVHAVAYGLIVDALGRSLEQTLKRHGRLVPERAAREFEEGISEYVEEGIGRIARLALEQRSGRG